MKNFLSITAVGALAFCATANAQYLTNQDDCMDSGVDNVGPGIYIALTFNATTGSEGQSEPCAGAGNPVESDIWFTYTAVNNGDVRIYTCLNENINTKLVAWPGAPSCPVDGTSLACNNNGCDERSLIRFPVSGGQSYIIQLGHPDIGSLIPDPIMVVIDEVPSINTIGDSYCGPGNVNSTGMTAQMVVTGSLVLADNNVNFSASGVPPGEFGYYLVSRTQDYFRPPGSLGNMCLGGDVGRYNFAILQDPFTYSPDLNNLPTNNAGSQQTLPGETLNFQLWYRDGSTYSGFSNGMSLTFQ